MNTELPISNFEGVILETVEKNPVTIIVGETGSGKSTQIGQLLLDNSNYNVVITQPRRLAARTVATRVAYEMNVTLGQEVGYRTSLEKVDSSGTRCLFCTDGLQLVRELTSARKTLAGGIILVIDEVHEWNLNIETLIAWCKKSLADGGVDFKIILMSATLDSKQLSDYFDGAPIITIPGKVFPVIGSPLHEGGIVQAPEKDLIHQIMQAIANGDNTLVFLPGKPEIAWVNDELALAGVKANVVELHGDNTPEEQNRAFRSYDGLPKVVLATNIAQTSVTIPDITCVIDSGKEKRIELHNGVETLTLGIISKADVIQRAGRAGRVQEGTYVLCNDHPYQYFEDYAKAEIQRVRLDQVVLRLKNADIDATELDFYHQPDRDVLMQAKKTLYAIGALDEQGHITAEGKRIAKFPVGVKTAKMILEAVRRRCVAPILTIAAIMETSYASIKRMPKRGDAPYMKSWRLLIGERKYRSDLLVELELFKMAQKISPSKLDEKGISSIGYGKACEIRGQLKKAVLSMEAIHNDEEVFERLNTNANDETALLKCIMVGMVDHVYIKSFGTYKGDQYDVRDLNRDSILNSLEQQPEWIVGEPKNLTFKRFKGNREIADMRKLITNATAIEYSWLQEIVPHLIQKKQTLTWSWSQARVVCKVSTLINHRDITTEDQDPAWSPEGFELFLDALVSNDYLSHGWFKTYISDTRCLLEVKGIEGMDQQNRAMRDHWKNVLMPHQVQSLKKLQEIWELVRNQMYSHRLLLA